MDILISLLTGGVAAAFVKIIDSVLQWKLKRKDKQDDAAETEKKRHDAVSSAICEGMKVLLYDRIRYLGQAFICAGEVDFDERRNLTEMHRVYHNGLGGNGDLDNLMGEVNRLPLKGRE